MMKIRNINLVLFSFFLIILIALPILCVDRYLSHPDAPWQLTPFNADSLSAYYKEHYMQLKPDAIVPMLQDSSRPLVMVLVDGWGVPYDESSLKYDFDFFANGNPIFMLHRRLLQYTVHAENVEYKRGFSEGVFLERGDSVSCERKSQFQSPFFKQIFCCLNCDDFKMLQVLDSLVADKSWNSIAWTVKSTRNGDDVVRYRLLKGLSEVASRHPDVQFVIQGTHRPILGSPDVRRQYLAPWVPVVFINCGLKESVLKQPQ